MMDIRALFQHADRSAIEDYCRKSAQQAYVGDNVAIARVLGKLLMYVDTRDLSLTPHLLMNGFWEMWVTQAIASYVKPGMRCIDVGANVGYYTLLLSELAGDKGVVVAYEPVWSIVDLLKKSIIVNGSSAQVLARAASDRRGTSEFFVAPGFGGSGSLKEFWGSEAIGVTREAIGVTREARGHQGEVLTSSIDDDLVQIPIVDFVKIDVQGSELDVLRGMKLTIARSPKIAIAMEFTPSEHPDPAAAIEEILSYGLSLRAIGTDGIARPISPADAEKPDTGDHRMLWLQR